MSEELSILSLVLQAGPVVQLVMATLVLASVFSWVAIFQRTRVLSRAQKHARLFEDTFWSGAELVGLYKQVVNSPNLIGLEAVFKAGFQEFTRLRQDVKSDPEAVMEGVHRAMRVARAKEEERLEAHLPFLATVGSISPYIGLFGTVWGIMNSFRGLATVKQATLATVAPGISEALVATAIGLFAAIPAVIAYNRFNAKVDSLAMTYENFADEFAAILHRRVHQRGE
ncbi:MAG TPA: protein TolQ [Gammaproteobacteria bacterium]|nr:protein TolQ [Gammaproteobacteria bacterium]